jgi:hypothetical protein
LFSILGEGPVLASDAARQATEAEVTPRTLRRAKKALGVKSQRQGFGRGAKYYWVRDPENELDRQLWSQEMDTLTDKLCQGAPTEDVAPREDTGKDASAPPASPSQPSYHDDADEDRHSPDWWKQGRPDDQSDDDGPNSPVVP